MISRSIPPKSIHYKDGEWDIVLRPFDPEDAGKFQQALYDLEQIISEMRAR